MLRTIDTQGAPTESAIGHCSGATPITFDTHIAKPSGANPSGRHARMATNRANCLPIEGPPLPARSGKGRMNPHAAAARGNHSEAVPSRLIINTVTPNHNAPAKSIATIGKIPLRCSAFIWCWDFRGGPFRRLRGVCRPGRGGRRLRGGPGGRRWGCGRRP